VAGRPVLTAAVANPREVAKRALPQEGSSKAIASRPEGPAEAEWARPSVAAEAAAASPARRRVRRAASVAQAAALPPGEPAVPHEEAAAAEAAPHG